MQFKASIIFTSDDNFIQALLRIFSYSIVLSILRFVLSFSQVCFGILANLASFDTSQSLAFLVNPRFEFVKLDIMLEFCHTLDCRLCLFLLSNTSSHWIDHFVQRLIVSNSLGYTIVPRILYVR